MRSLRAWLLRLRGLCARHETDADFTAELEAHLQLHVDDGVRAGMTPAEARRVALLKLGSIEALRDAYRDRAGVPALAAVARDLRFGARLLRRQPGFAVAVVATLALGIGANTAVFSVVDAVLLRPLPYPEPERIVEVTGPGQGFVRFGRVFQVSPPALRESRAFSALGLYMAGGANLGADRAVRVAAAAVTPGFFEVIGARPALGRTFRDDEVAVSSGVVVISDRLWRERFDRDPAILGRTLTIDGYPFTVLGVMPPGVGFPDNALLWVPANAPSGIRGQIPVVTLVARLAAGVTPARARDQVLAATAFDEARAATVQVLPLREALVGAVRPIAVAIWAAAALVLLVACINTANLLLVRVAGRGRELAVRRAIGATRFQLIRQIIAESCMLSVLGGVAAIPVAVWTVEAARLLLPAALHGVADVAIDARAVAATGALALLAALLFGLGPAVSVRGSDSGDALRAMATSRGAGLAWRRFRSALVVAEIAVALILLAGATVLVQGIRAIMAVDIGVRGDRALTVELSLPRGQYRTADQHREFFTRLEQAVGDVAGVEAAGVSKHLPGRAPDLLLAHRIAVEGLAASGGQRLAVVTTASAGYFSAAGIDLLAGRSFTDLDRPDGRPVVIVSESFAQTLGLRPAELVGVRLQSSIRERGAPPEVVGVVRDVRLFGPEAPFDTTIYVPHAVDPVTYGPAYLVVRASGDPRAVVPAIRAAAAEIDPGLPLYNVRTFDEIRAALFAERRLAMLTVVTFAGLAFALSCVGLYGVIGYLVQHRTREIGIRLAIGAPRSRVCRQILATGLAHALGGVALGVPAALVMSQIVSSRLPGIDGIRPIAVATLTAVIVAVALLATAIPAWRAARIDPALTLRAET